MSILIVFLMISILIYLDSISILIIFDRIIIFIMLDKIAMCIVLLFYPMISRWFSQNILVLVLVDLEILLFVLFLFLIAQESSILGTLLAWYYLALGELGAILSDCLIRLCSFNFFYFGIRACSKLLGGCHIIHNVTRSIGANFQ